jgi:tetratricopeptide (TPR) repeat protein
VTDALRTTEVARILGVSPRRVRAMVQAGWCHPDKSGRAFAFQFQDLVILRTAHGLARAHVPARRVKRALNELIRQLPPERSLSGVRISAADGRVVVRDRDAVWQPESGQMLLDFSVDDLARKTPAPRPVRAAGGAQQHTPEEESAAEWFERAVKLEDEDPEAARAAYQRALDLDPDLCDAYVNLGRLAHESGDPATAARCYHHALERDELDSVTHYNLALALEDLKRNSEALAHYRRAVALAPSFADAHFNLSQLLGRMGRRAEALRHMVRYRQLLRRK